MSKIANDLRLMASGPRVGLAEIMLPARQPGSSIMPGKVNPVMPEVINQIAFQVIGNDHTICLASEAGQLELNVMEPVLVFNLLQSISIMNNGFRAFTDNCLKGIEANEDRLKEYVEKSVGIITAVNPHIGYEAAARVAKEAIATGQSVRELCVKNGVLSARRIRVNSRSIRNDTPRDCRSNSFKEKLKEEGDNPLFFVYNIEMLYMNRGRDVMSKFTVASNGALETTLRGAEVLSTPLLNKGVAFTQEEEKS